MKKPIIMIISAILLILTIIFTLQNAAEVQISYFFWEGTASLALLLFITLAVGIISSVMLLVPVIAHLNQEIKRKNQHASATREKRFNLDKKKSELTESKR